MEANKNQTIEELFENHTLLIIPKDGTTSKCFSILIQLLLAEGIECSCGYLPELSTKETECVYFPKILDTKEMYESTTQDDQQKENIKQQFAHMKLVETEYTSLEHFKKGLVGKSEVELFMHIEGFGGILFTNGREYQRGNLVMEDEAFKQMQKEIQEKQEACLPFLAPFGLTITKQTFKEKREEYQKWYRHWKNWLDGFSDKEWKNVEKLLVSSDPSLIEYLPKTKWNEN